MTFEYKWKSNEANFGPPIPKQVPGGCHITCEIIPQYKDKIIALRRPQAIPGHELPPDAENHQNGLLYFCHNLIRYGESIEDFVQRTVQQQTGVSVKNYKILDIESQVQDKDKQWAFTPYILATLDTLPSPSQDVTEVIQFTRDNIPDDFGWWTKSEVQEFLISHNL